MVSSMFQTKLIAKLLPQLKFPKRKKNEKENCFDSTYRTHVCKLIVSPGTSFDVSLHECGTQQA